MGKFACALVVVVTAGCAGPGYFTDGSSVSVGSFNRGALRRGARLPAQGDGWVVPHLWQERGANYATDELVAAVEHVAARVRREYPGAQLGVGDMSLRGGGDSVLHRSHENGRDLDLIYYAVDERGRPVAPVDSMPRYPFFDLRAREPGPQEHGVVFGPFSTRFFDVKRNWALVRALLEEPGIEIQYLFIHARLRERLLAYAAEQGEDPSLLERAEAILHQPGDSAPHDDHLHVRIFCADNDRAFGCRDSGPVRWWKKRYKYMVPTVPRIGVDELAGALAQLIGIVR
ncbi:MAG TPA: penicillin-insensitive murein endopeptidase [Polyangia bacterium]